MIFDIVEAAVGFSQYIIIHVLESVLFTNLPVTVASDLTFPLFKSLFTSEIYYTLDKWFSIEIFFFFFLNGLLS